MNTCFNASEEYEIKAADFWFYVESNYGLRNSKITANDVSDAMDKHTSKNLPSRHKDRYKE
jgi:hypothetical protein